MWDADLLPASGRWERENGSVRLWFVCECGEPNVSFVALDERKSMVELTCAKCFKAVQVRAGRRRFADGGKPGSGARRG